MAGRGPFRIEAAERLRDELRRADEVIRRRGTFADAAERDEVLGLYREALRTLEDRMAGGRRGAVSGARAGRRPSPPAGLF